MVGRATVILTSFILFSKNVQTEAGFIKKTLQGQVSFIIFAWKGVKRIDYDKTRDYYERDREMDEILRKNERGEATIAFNDLQP